MIFRIILAALLFSLVACSTKKTTPELADEMSAELRRLPSVLTEVSNEEDAEAAVKKIHEMRDAIVLIVQQVPEGEYLTTEERMIIDRQVRAAQDESAFILQKLSGKPEVIAMLSESLIELGDVMEAASEVMRDK